MYAALRGDALNAAYDGYSPVTFLPDPNDDSSTYQKRSWRGSAGGSATFNKVNVGLDAAHTVTTQDFTASPGGALWRGTEDYLSAKTGLALLTPGASRTTAMDEATLTLGTDIRHDTADTDSIDASSHDLGVWAQALGGSRYLEGSLTGRVDNDTISGTEGTGRAGLAILPVPQVKFHGSIATGYRAPSLNELYFPTYGNPNVEAQRTTGYDVGHDTTLPGDLSFSNVWFRTDYRQGLGYDQNFVTANTGSFRISGLENALHWREDQDGFRAVVTYTFQQTDLDDGDRTGGRGFALVPSHKASFMPGWYHDRFWIAGQVDAVGRRNLGTTELHGYALLGLRAGYKITSKVEVYVRGENLGNTTYEVNPGYSTQPISGFAGVNATF